jgi:hypothetical protein
VAVEGDYGCGDADNHEQTDPAMAPATAPAPFSVRATLCFGGGGLVARRLVLGFHALLHSFVHAGLACCAVCVTAISGLSLQRKEL